MTQYKEVPFTTFGTVNHQITLEMQASTQRSRLVIDHSTYIDMPEKVVPLKCLELENGLILVFGKVMFTGQLRMFSVDAEGTHLVENKLPDELSYHIFEQAFVYRGQVLVVLFDVLKSEMKCYRWKISPDTNAPIVDPANYYHLAFNEDNIHVAEYRDKVYFVGEGLCYVYNENSGVGVLEQLELPGQLFVIELKSTPFGIAGLFLDEALASLPTEELRNRKIHKLFDLETRTEIFLDRTYRVPFNLRYEGGWVASDVTSPEDLGVLLSFDLHNSMPSGMKNLGGNNSEGLVAWSQVYYLNGLINLVKKWDNSKADFRFLGNLRDDLKLRLDLEVYLLDRLLDEGNPGFLSKRYSVDRTPALFASHTGRILRMLKRYANEVSESLPLRNFESFLKSTEMLEGHIEVLAVAEGEPETVSGEYFLKWPKGSAFLIDGVGLPYNQQNDWAGGVAYGNSSSSDSRLYFKPAKDMIVTFLRNEHFYTSPPADFLWRYWYGQGALGWQANDGISMNTPTFTGVSYAAHISYRTIDAMAALSVAKIYPEILPESFIVYVQEAVERNSLYLFTSEELLKYDILPQISSELAAMNVRVKVARELQNSTWAILSLYHQFPQPD